MHNTQQVFLYMKEEIEQSAKVIEEKLLQEAEDLEQQACAQVRKEVKKEIEDTLQKEVAQMTTNAKIMKSLKQAQRKSQLVKKREQYVHDIFTQVKENLVAFSKSTDYKQHLVECAKKVKEEYSMHNVIIHVKEEDLQYTEDIIEAYRNVVNVVSNDTMVIGGLIIENKSDGIIIDKSLDFALENQKEWFYHTSGLTID